MVDYGQMREMVKRVLPTPAATALQQIRARWRSVQAAKLPVLSEGQLRGILTDDLRLQRGDVVFVHSSVDDLHLRFSPLVVLSMMLELVGSNGTLLFPTYPKLGSYEFLISGQVFDIRRTPSYMGLLTEMARRHTDAVRSLHPTKSVVAIGRFANELTSSHHLSPYPYDRQSPYGKLLDYDGKVIGLGVSTSVLSFAHCVEDNLRDDFPVRLYHPQFFAAPCIDRHGRNCVVETYAHDLGKMKHNIPAFIKAHVAKEICRDFQIDGRKFFSGKASGLFQEMSKLARSGVTIYPQHQHD